MSKITFRTSFNRTSDSIKDVSCVKFTEPSKVKASLSYATDIKTIYENYCREGRLPLNGQQPIYDENFVNYDDLITAQKLCSDASSYFNGLPADIKKNYDNDLNKFIKALNSKDTFLINKGVLNLISNESDVKDTSSVSPSSSESVSDSSNTDTSD